MPPWTPLHAHLHHRLRRDSLLPRGSTILVAVSGGQDSLSLLRLLLDLQDKWDWRLLAAHGDHQWRDDSAANAVFVQDLCQQWDVPCQVVRATGINRSEAAARQWRYQMLTELAVAQGCGYVVTGHTATDRAETLLYNLIRGSGSDGLQALTWQRPLSPNHPTIQLVRPLLDLTRQQTDNFCQQFQISIWPDRSNQDLNYARNRLRLEVLPYLQTHFNPRVEHNLAQTAELLTADVDFIEQAAARLYDAVVHPGSGPIVWRIQCLPLQSAHPALQRRVMRRFLQQISPRQVNFDQVIKLVALIDAPNRTQTDPFPGGGIARVTGEWIEWLGG